MKRVTVLGSTGSIGTQTLDVISRCPDRFSVHALAAGSDVDAMAAQVDAFRPARAAMASADAAAELRSRFPSLDVSDDPVSLAVEGDVVLNAIVGAAGLRATLASLDAGLHVALANKESCVAGGPLVRRGIDAGATLVPVDSEHAAVHMCVDGERVVSRLVITASGGPFRGLGADALRSVSVEDALKHPTWAMGPKITIDSATLMNKGLEVLEANLLFGVGFDDIDVVCHPQSVVHCLVAFPDGSWKASLAPPDMRVPIAYALGYPERVAWGAELVDWSAMRDLTFEPVDRSTFRCVDLAFEAGRTGGTAPAVLNAANEVAVAAFLDEGLPFLGIADVVERTLQAADVVAISDLDDVLRADAWARAVAEKFVTAFF